MPAFTRAFLLPLAVVLVAAVAPAADPQVRLSPEWNKGDKVEYEFTKGRERKKGDKVVVSGSSTTQITVEVLKAGDKEVELAWTFGETKLSDPTKAKALGNMMKGQRVVFTLDPKVGITGVKNFDELQKVTDEMLDLLTASMVAGDVLQKEIDQVRTATKAQFANPAGAVVVWLKEPAMLFFLVGETLTPNKPHAVREELPNPFGGDPLPTVRRMELTKVDAKAGTATVTVRAAFDEKAVEVILAEVVKAMTKKLGKEPPNAAAIKGFRLIDDAEYMVSTKTGWVEKAKYVRTVSRGQDLELETNEFVRKPK